MRPREHRILFDARIARDPKTGATRYVTSLLAAMIPRLAADERLYVILGPDSVSMPFLAAPQVEFRTVSAPVDRFRSRYETARFAWAIAPEVFQATAIFTPVRVPGRMVVSIHDLMPLAYPQYSSFWTRLNWRVRGWQLMSHCRVVIGVSESLLKDYKRLFGSHGCSQRAVVYDGIGGAFAVQAPEALQKVRADYRLPERFFLYLGSDGAHKNLETLLEAYALLEPTAALPLVLAGFDPAASAVPAMIERLKLGELVRCLGCIPEERLPALYGAAHAFVMPSLVESFGLPVLEAMACGTPVICSALASLKEVTAGAAMTVHPTDRQEWKRALQTAAGSLGWRDDCRAKGLERAKDFSWQRTAAATLGIYRSLYRKHFFG